MRISHNIILKSNRHLDWVKLYNYKYSSRCTSMWLIPIVDATLTTEKTTPLRSSTDDSTSWCCKHVKITLRKSSCEVNWNLTNNCHWRLCVHYRGISKSMIMETCSFYGRGSFGVENSLIYLCTTRRSKPKRWYRDLRWCLQS